MYRSAISPPYESIVQVFIDLFLFSVSVSPHVDYCHHPSTRPRHPLRTRTWLPALPQFHQPCPPWKAIPISQVYLRYSFVHWAESFPHRSSTGLSGLLNWPWPSVGLRTNDLLLVMRVRVRLITRPHLRHLISTCPSALARKSKARQRGHRSSSNTQALSNFVLLISRHFAAYLTTC